MHTSLFFLLFISFRLSYCFGINFCPDIERQSLSSFKQSLKDPSNELSSWNVSGEFDCCKWKGMFCSNLTGHVHELDLQSLDLSGKLNPSLLNLKHLRILDLSGNDFNQTIPSFFVLFESLVALDLSDAGFYGEIPNVGSSTKFQYIDLASNYLNSTIPDWLYSCKDLYFLSLGSNSLHGTISNSIVNLTSLKFLDLRGNMFEGEISNSFGNMSHGFLESLEHLLLSHNQFSGRVPDQFGELKNLRRIDLWSTRLTGNLPQSLGNLYNLESLLVSHNMLEGIVTETHFANMTKLRYFYAGGNQLTLKVGPNWIPPFQQLTELSLWSWNLGGTEGIHIIPSWLHTLKNLKLLDLSFTGISGQVPSWIWNIPSLNLDVNSLYGEIPPLVGGNSDRVVITLSSNQFSGALPQVDRTVMLLDLSSNSFTGDMSSFLCHDHFSNETNNYAMRSLRLQGNQLTGELPDCWQKWKNLVMLDLGDNNITGSIPNSIGSLANLRFLNFYNNKLSGQIPLSIHNCTELVKIDIGFNNLDGGIPTFMGTSLQKLRVVILRSNKLSGQILSPDLCRLSSLQILDLSDNNFDGTISRCVNNFTAMATKRSLAKLGYRGMDYVIETNLTYSPMIEDFVTVTTKGRRMTYATILSLVTNIDLSNNYLSGEIPKELTSLVELQSLNLSGNQLTGPIPDTIGGMKQLESLDLSGNSIFGQIPNSFTSMSSLSYLNLSYNNLTGKVPESAQITGLDASSFMGNNLCGLPLKTKCSNGDGVPDGAPLINEDNESKIDWLYLFVSMGYAVGFSTVCTTLVLKKSWRDAYFELMEDMWDKVYVYIYIKWTKFVNWFGLVGVHSP